MASNDKSRSNWLKKKGNLLVQVTRNTEVGNSGKGVINVSNNSFRFLSFGAWLCLSPD